MALERQKTLSTGFTQNIDVEVDKFLNENEIDVASIQLVVDNGRGQKTATITYAERKMIKDLYEKQGRKYSEADKVTYFHTKDIVCSLNEDLDNIVNEFLFDENVAATSVCRYFTPVNKGAFICYIDLKEQQEKADQKRKEFEAMQEEMAQKLATEAVKDVELKTDDTIEKYAEKAEASDKNCCECSDLAENVENEECQCSKNEEECKCKEDSKKKNKKK